jgi:glycosyltransferase involved in cell wall biosynthesis
MRLLYLNYHFDDNLREMNDLIARYHSSRDWCQAVADAGALSVTVLQRFHVTGDVQDGAVRYHFVRDSGKGKIPFLRNPHSLHRIARNLRPDIVHYNGSPLQIFNLRREIGDSVPIVWQHHGQMIPKQIRKMAYQHYFRSFDGFFFAAEEIASDWVNRRIIPSKRMTHEIMEASSMFQISDQSSSKAEFSLSGDEVFLWVGRLNDNKDPMTVVDGFAEVVSKISNPHLYMIYSEDDMLQEVRMKIRDLHLEDRIHLLGHIPHILLQKFYSASDYFVLGSHHEGSGFALLEAISTGLVPIVTNIPTFRKILAFGAIGALWEPVRTRRDRAGRRLSESESIAFSFH